MGGGMQGVQIGWGVLAFVAVVSLVSQLPIGIGRSVLGKDGGTNGVRIGWKFLAERISAEADVHWSAILGLFYLGLG